MKNKYCVHSTNSLEISMNLLTISANPGAYKLIYKSKLS